MPLYLQSNSYATPLEHVQLGRYTIAAADATVADDNRLVKTTPVPDACMVTLVAASDTADKLYIRFPAASEDAPALAGLYIKLEANSTNALAVSASDTTGEINIKLANSTQASNANDLIQTAIRAVTPVGGSEGVVKGIDVSGVVCTAGENWNTAAKAPGANMSNVPFAGGDGLDIVAADFEAQPSCPRNIYVKITSGSVLTGADIAAVKATVYGTDINDQTISEEIGPWVATEAATKAGAQAFKTVTSVHMASHNGADATFEVGTGEILGIPFKFSKKPLYWVTRDGVIETTAPAFVADADEVSKNTIDLNGALNSKELCVYLAIPEA